MIDELAWLIMAVDPRRFAHAEPMYPVHHRKKVPFHPLLKMPEAFAARATRIQTLEREMGRFIPRAEDYFEVISEARAVNIHRSISLEGNQLSENQVRRITRDSMAGHEPKFPGGKKRKDAQEVLNHIGFWSQPDFLPPPWTIDSIALAHVILLDGVENDELRGRFRGPESDPWVIVSDVKEELFIAAGGGHVREELESLLAWLNSMGEGLFPVVAAAVFFHEFESIHPFKDGNGRTGRALFHAYVQQHGLPNSHLCPIEPALLDDRELYYRVLSWTDSKGDYTTLIDFFMDAVLQAYETAHERLQSKDILSTGIDEVDKRLLTKAREERAWFSVTKATSWIAGRGEQTLRKRLNNLVDEGALETVGKTRSKRYRFPDPITVIRHDREWKAEALREMAERRAEDDADNMAELARSIRKENSKTPAARQARASGD